MTRKHFSIAILVILLAIFNVAMAQDQGGAQKTDSASKDQASTASSEQPSEGVNTDGYNIRQTIEIGGRILSSHGSPETYNTFVNLHSGPRLLEQSLEMRSLPGSTGQFFDHLSMSTFGFGGDPNDVARVRLGKRKFYDFSGMFRRDKNYWDYNLFVNPYNPPVPAGTTTFPLNPFLNQSAHAFDLVRRMTDLGLTLAPDSVVSVRLGFNHNVMEGTSYTTMHEGGDVMLLQPWKMRTNDFRFGVDFKMIPRTRISFDQIFDWYRQDTDALNMPSPMGDFVTYWQGTAASNLTPVNPGVVWFYPSAPCANPVADNSVTPMVLTPTCSAAYISYSRTMPLRGRFPTSVVSLKSNYFRFMDLSFRGGYSDGEQNVSNYSEAWAGALTRTREQTSSFAGPMHNRRVSGFANTGVTIYLPHDFRINDTFSWNNYRSTGAWDSTETATFSNRMDVPANLYNSTTCPTGAEAACPQHSSSSPADLGSLLYSTFHKFDTKMNLIELEFGLTKKAGFRAGYRWRKRSWVQSDLTTGTEIYYPNLAVRGDCAAVGDPDITPSVDPVTGVCTVALTGNLADNFEFMPQITDNSFVGGVWVRPVQPLLLEFDTEISHGNQVYTRLSPRNSQEYRLRANYKPQKWFSFGAVADLIKVSNDWIIQGDSALGVAPSPAYDEHNRTVGFNFSVFPTEWFSLDMGYDYNDFSTHAATCYLYSVTPSAAPTATATPAGTGTTLPNACAPWDSEPGTIIANLWVDDAFYTNHTHSGFFNLVLKPVKRVTTTFGYTLTSNAASSTGTTGLLPIYGPYSPTTTMQTTYGLNPYAPVGAIGSNYHLPSILLAIDLSKQVMFKAGWNYYDYNEKFPAGYTAPRDFAANVTTLSLRYSF